MATPIAHSHPAWSGALRPERPHGRSLADFGALSPAEKKLLECCRDGAVAKIAARRPKKGTRANRARAAFVRFLALGGDEQTPVHERGVQLRGAWLTGILDLQTAAVLRPLILWTCRIERVVAYRATLTSLSLNRCRLMKGLQGDGLRCESSLFLRGLHATGEVRLVGATVGGDLECDRSRLENGAGIALILDGATIGGSVYLRGGFHATGQVRLLFATIGSSLEFQGSRFENGAGIALFLDGAIIRGGVFLRDGFHAVGQVRLLGATIGGSLECIGGHFENCDGEALSCDRLQVSGHVLLRAPFRAIGTVRLSGAAIGGNLECDGGRFDAAGIALTCHGATISGSVFLRDGFSAAGKVDLGYATIGRLLECVGAAFWGGGGAALSCPGTRVMDAFVFRPRAGLAGAVNLSSMHVATLRDDTGSWDDVRAKGQRAKLLRAMELGTDRPAPDGLVLDGFTYDRLGGVAATDSATRIGWLDLQWNAHLDQEFRPQPWEQLIAVLRAMGHPEQARAVAIGKQVRLRRAKKIPFGARTLHRLYGLLVGYGYRPMRLLAATASVWLVCAAAYWASTNPAWFGADTHLLAPPPAEQHPGATAHSARPVDYRNFVPLIYSADVLLPVVDLGYKKEWQPVVADGAGNPLPWGRLLRFLYWFEIAFGWVAGLLLVGVLGNLIKKD